MRRRRVSTATRGGERLECRTLLVGNVTAQLAGSTVFVRGDGGDNSVELLLEEGNVILRGQEGTTVNGATTDFVLGNGSLTADLRVSLGEGNDTFVVNGVTISRNALLDGGSGNDQLVVAGMTNIGQRLTIRGQRGNDVINLQDSFVGGNVRLLAHSGNDMVTVATTQIGRNLVINGGDGSDDIVVDGSRVGRDTRITGWGGHDDIVIRDSELADDLNIATHRGADVVYIESSTVGDKSAIRTGSGADNVVLLGTTRFFDRLNVFGGRAPDNFDASAEVVFDGLRRRSFAGLTAHAATVEERITSQETGAIAAAERTVAAFGDELVLSISETSVTEGAGDGAALLSVTRSGDISESLEVTFSSSDATRLVTEQSSILIPAGQASSSVLLNPQDNRVVDGNSVVTITAAASGFNDVSASIEVADDDGDTLQVSITPGQVQEDSGNLLTVGAPNSFSVSVSRTGDTSADLVVTLTASIDGEISIPSEVTIPAGQQSVSVNGQTMADGVSEADRSVVVTASATGLQSANDTVTVLDNDAPRLSLTLAAPTVSESGAASSTQVTVTRNSATTDELVVTLNVDQPGSLTVPSTVTIGAGETSAEFTVTAVDDFVVDGDVVVVVTASAAGFSDGNTPIVTEDDDVPTLTVTLPNGNSVAEGAGVSAITATISRNTIDTSEAVQVTLTLTGDDRLSGPGTAIIPAGSASVDVSFDAGDNQIVDQPADGTVMIAVNAGGFVGSTANVLVTNDDPATLTISPILFSVLEDGGTTSLNLSRNDAAGSEVISLTYSNTSLITGPSTVEFAAGEEMITIPLTIINNLQFSANESVMVTAGSASHAGVFATINVVNDEILSLSTDVSGNNAVMSNGILVTNADTFTITGVTAPGVTVSADNDGDGQFDDATVVAEADGTYEIVVAIAHDANNLGVNSIQLQAMSFDGETTLSSLIKVHRSVGTVVRFETNQDFNSDGMSDFFDIELLDADAPLTVANFLGYTDTAATGTERFDNLLLQRSDDNFIVQAGRFNKIGDAITELDRDVDNNGLPDTIQNEFNSDNSNLRGTLSMALPAGQPNGGSSEWFINTADNTFLDDPGRLHTVFGRVIGEGMDVVDAANQLPVFDLNEIFNSGALGEVPLDGDPFAPLSGAVALSSGSAVVTGTGTAFLTDLNAGDFVRIGGSVVQVQSVDSDTELTIDVVANSDVGNLQIDRYEMPAEDSFVVFTNIEAILDHV